MCTLTRQVRGISSLLAACGSQWLCRILQNLAGFCRTPYYTTEFYRTLHSSIRLNQAREILEYCTEKKNTPTRSEEKSEIGSEKLCSEEGMNLGMTSRCVLYTSVTILTAYHMAPTLGVATHPSICQLCLYQGCEQHLDLHC